MSAPTTRLWDPVVRLFHWSLAGAFLANYFFTEEGESWHRWLGYYAVAWLAIRLVWGFVGTPAARWADFWPTRARLAAHLRALLGGQPHHRLGHTGGLVGTFALHRAAPDELPGAAAQRLGLELQRGHGHTWRSGGPLRQPMEPAIPPALHPPTG